MPTMVLWGNLFGVSLGPLCPGEAGEQLKDGGSPASQTPCDSPGNTSLGRSHQSGWSPGGLFGKGS